MYRMLVTATFVLVTSASNAALVTIEPDDYAVGTDISNAVAGAHLSVFSRDAVAANQIVTPVFTAGPVYSRVGMGGVGGATGATGSMVFGGSLYQFSNTVFGDIEHTLSAIANKAPYKATFPEQAFSSLRVDFDSPTSYVDVLGIALQSDTFRMAAFNNSGTMVAETTYFNELYYLPYPSDLTPYRMSSSNTGWVQASITRPDADISYVIMGGSENHREFDRFRFESVVPVPSAVWLFGSGLIGLVGVTRKRTAR